MIAKTSSYKVVVTHQQEVTHQEWLNSEDANHLGESSIGQKSPKMAPFLITCCLNYSKPEFLANNSDNV